MKRVVGELGVKAAGGIRSLQDVLALVRAGADRIGSSSAISIIKEVEKAG
jgi:deoxyribose-phosphate aldolase